jgi:hypothetical protein
MSNNLIPLDPSFSELEPFNGGFRVPRGWTSCGPAVYITGAPALRQTQPVAVALTETTLSLCGPKGPIWALHIASIKDVRVTSLTGISIPIDTEAGRTHLIPPLAIGVEVTYNLAVNGAGGHVVWWTMKPNAAYEWVNDIVDAINDLMNGPSDVEQRKGGQ